jgi:hypothetical protein
MDLDKFIEVKIKEEVLKAIKWEESLDKTHLNGIISIEKIKESLPLMIEVKIDW